MPSLRNAIARILGKPILGRRISPTSLQFRLTLELITLSVLGIGSVAIWSGWRMEQTLISAHKQNLEYIAMHFPEQVELYRQTGSVEMGVERTIDRLSTSELLIWVRSPDGQVVSRSSEINMPPLDWINLLAPADIPAQPTVFYFGGRYVVLCGSPLTVNGNSLGQVYILKDITDDQQRLNAGVHSLILVSVVAVVVLMIAIAKRIRRALQPLEQMSQVASAVSADDLSGAKLELQRAPDEILGLAQAFNDMGATATVCGKCLA
jgi:methyl-accepting chemotaxis protein